MSYMMSLEIARDLASTKNARALFDDDVRRAITLYKLGASIADLMLFDRSSLAEARNGGEPPYRILLSDRISAVERFKRRLPCVLEALSWHPIAVETMPRFGKFFESIDWPYVLLETDEYRCNFWDSEWFTTSEEFDRTLEFAVSAIDDRAIAAPGQRFRWRRPLFTSLGEAIEILLCLARVDLCGRQNGTQDMAMGSPGLQQQLFKVVEDLPSFQCGSQAPADGGSQALNAACDDRFGSGTDEKPHWRASA